jgi:pectin methylesterase-like acyl-CoA thioesterase
VLAGASSANLSIANTALADAGNYSVTVTNPVSSVSSAAALTVNQAPTVSTQPQGGIVNPGVVKTLQAGFGASFPAPTYSWEKSSDGITYNPVSGATSASLQLTGSSATTGFYRVIATNSVGSVTSQVIYFGIPSTQSVSFAPGNNATNISIDQQLRLVFPSPPKLGLTGVLQIRDASNDGVVATIDRSQFVGYTSFGGTVINSAIETRQGKALYYLPIAIYGNEVWVTLSAAQRLAYGKTYYVTMDAGLLLDSGNAAFPGISSPAAWRFSTRTAGPATPTASTGPTTITVGLDGTGDFATIQGASDWVPQNNTLPRTIRVKPGIYRDIAYFAQNRNFVTLIGDGASRNDVQLYQLYPSEVFAGAARGMGVLNIASHDVTVRDLTVDIADYIAQPNLAGGFAPGAPAFAGAINTVFTTGKRLIFDNVLMKGGQDTLYTNTGIAHFNKCEIWGSVDFIYGDALAVFDQCNIVQIRDSGGPIGAPNTPLAQPHGLVFLNCTFPRALKANGFPYDVGTNNTTFMRPWRQDGATAIINCQLGAQISTKGWGEWDSRENTCRAREYGSSMMGGGNAVTPAQRQAAGAYWLNTIDPDYTSASMLPTDASLVSPGGITNRVLVTVNPADYTLSAIFGHAYYNLNGWLPALMPRITGHPAGRNAAVGEAVTMTVVATGAPTPTYQWYKNGAAIPGATAASHTIASAVGTDWGNYTAAVTNSVGSITSNVATLTINDPMAVWANGNGLDPAANGAPDADPDGDGMNNKMEFFLGANPKQASTALLPKAHMTPDQSAWVFEFDRNNAASGVAYSIEYAADLTTGWNTLTPGQNGVTLISAPVDANTTHFTVTVPVAAIPGDKSKFFTRLKL